MKDVFYGWRIVAACMLCVTISWSLGIFGMGVYIYALTRFQGFSVSLVSAGVTAAYVLGLDMVCRSTNTAGSTLAPWFERL